MHSFFRFKLDHSFVNGLSGNLDLETGLLFILG